MLDGAFHSPTTIDLNYNANCMKLKKSYPTDTVTLTPDEFNTKILNTYSVQGAIQSIERDETDPNSKIIVKYYKINDIEKNLNNDHLAIPNNYKLKTIEPDGKTYKDYDNGRNSSDFNQNIDPIFKISDFNIKCTNGAALAGYKYINNKVYPICVTFDNTDLSGKNDDDSKSDGGSNSGSNGDNDGKGNGDGDDDGKGNSGNNGDDDGKGNGDGDDPKTTEESFWTSTTAIIIYVCLSILFVIFIIFIIGFVTMSGGGDYQGGVVYV